MNYHKATTAIAALIFLSTLFLGADAGAQTAQSLFEQGVRDYQNENFEEALELFLQARKLDPRATNTAFFTGLTYKQMERFAEAITHFKDAVTQTPRIKEALVELIDSLYQTNDLKEANKWIAMGEKEGITSGKLLFLKGLVLLKEGKNLESVKAFEEAKKLDASIAQAAELQIATAYLKEGKLVEAKSRFQVAITLDPKSDIATYAKDYEKFLMEKMEREKPWRVSFGMGYKYDTNPTAIPGGGPVADVSTGESDSAINTTLRVGYTAPFSFTGPYSFGAYYSLYSDQYFKGKMDMINNSLTLVPGYNFSRFSFTLPVTYGRTWLKDKDSQEPWLNFSWGDKTYQDLVSVNPTVRIMITQSNAVEVSYGYQKKHFLQPLAAGVDPGQESRDADNYSGTVAWLYFTPIKGFLNVRYSYAKENADGVNWSYSDHKIALSFIQPIQPIFKEKLKIQLSGEYDFIEYENENATFGVKRRDDIYSGTASLIYEIIKNLSAAAGYTYTRNKSNLEDFYGYKREIVFVNLEYNF
jgi:tetratricopeptide (TPR) repeat protein